MQVQRCIYSKYIEVTDDLSNFPIGPGPIGEVVKTRSHNYSFEFGMFPR